MKYLVAGIIGLAVAELAFAETPSLPPGPAGPQPVETAPVAISMSTDSTGSSESADCTPRLWGGVEYLLWWIKDGPVAGPLVTRGNPADLLPGALGQPGTQVLLGSSPFDYGPLSGGRVTFGGWLDSEASFGAEVSGFLLEMGSTHFAAGSDANGNPPLYIPLINQTPTSSNFGHEGSVGIADVPNAGLIGGVAVSTTTRLWGAEANGVVNLIRSGGLSVDGLAGFRYVDLKENLALTGDSIDITGAGVNQSFIDQFGTSNQFYGGQLGTRVDYQVGSLLFEVVTKVALGANHQTVNIQGGSLWNGPGFSFPPGIYPGGILTEPSNIGQQTADHFAVIPQIEFKVGWNVTEWARLTLGYDYLYWNSVLRPGNQIDRNVNFTQIPGAQTFFGPPIAPFVPAPQFNRSDFWAQGLSIGLTFTY